MLGSVGAAHHYEYRAVGDIVNTVTRIQGLNKFLGTTTLASDAVLEGVEGLLTRPLGGFLLAGKTTPMTISELIATTEEANEAQYVLAGRFAVALRAFHAQDWCRAAEEFADLLADFPNDGPTRFYLARSKQFVAVPPGQPWDPAIPIDAK
jgi:adenylate cyclase